MNGRIWAHMRDAVLDLTSLPTPADAAKIVHSMDRQKLVKERLPSAVQYLQEFKKEFDRIEAAREAGQ